MLARLSGLRTGEATRLDMYSCHVRMKALILAGGKGTRLRPLTTYTPKPIVPLVNRPFAAYQIDLLRRAGVTDITFSLNYQPDRIRETLGDGSRYGVKLSYECEPRPLGTAGAVRFAARSCDEPLLVLNGDVLTDVRLRDLIQFHEQNKAAATIGLVRVPDPSRYGVAVLDDGERITGFLEKPQGPVEHNTINAGIYVLEPAVLDLIPHDVERSFEYDVFPAVLANDMRFFGHVLTDTYWRDIGTLESYLAAHMDFVRGRLTPPSDGQPVPPTNQHGGSDHTSIIGENCLIAPGATVENSVIGPNVRIDRDASIVNSVIWSNTTIASSVQIRDAIIGQDCRIGHNAYISHGTALADRSLLPDHARV
jgi:NDP-sugar pyrophosphorylase family protein